MRAKISRGGGGGGGGGGGWREREGEWGGRREVKDIVPISILKKPPSAVKSGSESSRSSGKYELS